MKPQRTTWAAPPAAGAPGQPASIEIVVPYTEFSLAVAAMERVSAFGARLSVQIRLVAVHTVPYPARFECPAAVHANLVEQLIQLASRSPVSVCPQVVLARNRMEGFQSVMRPESTVVMASRRRPWRTPEERLAAAFTAQNHNVALFYLE